MKDDIRAVKDSLLDIVDKLSARTEGLVIRFGVVSYRDHPPQDKTYVTRVFDLTENIRGIQREIGKLDPSQGGDTPEAVEDGLFDARTKLTWNKGAYKVLLLVGDAPPHGRQYNTLGDDFWPKGCPAGHDSREEVRLLKQEHGSTVFVFACGCNPLVEPSFRSIAEAASGRYYPLLEAHHLPDAILEMLQGVSDLIEEDKKVLAYYESRDGVFDLASAASDLKTEVRELKTSLSRLLELGKIPQWPKGRPLTASVIGLTVELGEVPDAILPGKAFKYRVNVRNPSASAVGLRIVVTLVTDEGVSEVTNEQHEISPHFDGKLELKLVPMAETRGKATVRVEVFYGSKSVASQVYPTRMY